ncbi:MAG: aminoglycoside 6-adenylyltransferase [Anaerolineae bacterium]|nr:aminoglycoside 6-adenylyltransferase [Anaerolineae bacterium]
MTTAYKELEKAFIRWAQAEENVRAALVIGSRARHDHPADEWSDLDVLIFANDPEPYWTTTAWLQHIGVPWLHFIEPTPGGQQFEHRVLFEGGLDVDFVPIPVANLNAMLDHGFPPDVADMVHRGARFLVDKESFAERLQNVKVTPPPYTPPAEPEFLNAVHDFWYHTVWTGKHLRRGEVWWAKSCCDGYLKHILGRMLAWHARASKGKETDTWMSGRFLEEWADARAVASLPAAFAHYDAEDIWRALLATMELFHWLAVETADLLGYAYPAFGEEQATKLVQALFAGWEEMRKLETGGRG